MRVLSMSAEVAQWLNSLSVKSKMADGDQIRNCDIFGIVLSYIVARCHGNVTKFAAVYMCIR